VDPEPRPRRPPTPWITIALVAANVIVFAWELASGADAMQPTPQKMIALGGNLPPLTLGGQWWRLGSAMFLHYGVLHIGMNMLCLWQARIVEVAFGRAAFATIYVVSGLLGGIATALHAQNVVSAGASGAVFGVYGAFFALLFVRRAAFPPDVWQKIVRQMATFLGINFALGFSVKGIDMSAHLGGLAAGALGGAALVLGTQRGPAKLARTLALAAAGLAIVAGVLVTKHGSGRSPSEVVERVPQIEEQCLDRFRTILARATDHQPTPADADEVERDVLAPWKAMRADLDALDEPDSKGARFAFEAMRRYVASRQAAFEAFVTLARAPADQQPGLAAAFRAAMDQSNQDAHAAAAAAGGP
jgi:rhomboid protease GluP